MLSVSDAPPIPEVDSQDRPQVHRSKGHRRVPTSRERRPDVVANAIPDGQVIAPRVSSWSQAALSEPFVATMDPRGRQNLSALCRALMASLHYKSRTVSPGTAYLASSLGVTTRTVRRHLALLRSLGYLATVASGRTARYTPKASGRVANERAVYVLTIPADSDVNKSVLPTTLGGGSFPPRARERLQDLKKAAAAPRGSLGAEPGGLGGDQAGAHRTVEPWPATKTVAGDNRRSARDARLAGAVALQGRVRALQATSPAWVAWACREFFEAGWTVADVAHAIDNRHDSERWPHDGADGVGAPARWLAYRLGAWRDKATRRPLKSRSQVLRDESDEARARAMAASEREAQRQARRAAGATAEDLAAPEIRVGGARFSELRAARAAAAEVERARLSAEADAQEARVAQRRERLRGLRTAARQNTASPAPGGDQDSPGEASG